MKPKAKENKTVEITSQTSSRSTKKTAKEIVNRHLKDKTDIITEEDMQNIQIETGLNGDVPLAISNKTNRPKDEDKDTLYTTPWDTISE